MKKITIVMLLLLAWVSPTLSSQRNQERIPTPTPVTSPEILPILVTANIVPSIDLQSQSFIATVPEVYNNDQNDVLEQELDEETVRNDNTPTILSGLNESLHENSNGSPFNNYTENPRQENEQERTPSPNRRNALTPDDANNIVQQNLPLITRVVPLNIAIILALRDL